MQLINKTCKIKNDAVREKIVGIGRPQGKITPDNTFMDMREKSGEFKRRTWSTIADGVSLQQNIRLGPWQYASQK